MQKAPLPENEASRLAALQCYRILDTDPEDSFDDLTALAAEMCGVPIALVSLIDAKRQWFKSTVGIDATETPRDIAFCAHAILQSDVFIVPDTLLDDRFADNPLVTNDPHIRFYAGMPLITSVGEALGTLCVIDRVPRQLTDSQQEALRRLGRQTVKLLEYRLSDREHREAASALRESETRVQDFLMSASDLIQSATLDGRFLFVNRAWLETLGYSEEDLPRLHLMDVIHPDCRVHCGQILQQLGASPSALALALETTFLSKSGRPIHVEGSVNCRVEEGRPVSTRAIFRDITARKQAEDEQSRLQRQLKSIMDAATQVSIIATDPQGTITLFNAGAERLLGYTAEEMVGTHTPKIFHLNQEVEAHGETLSKEFGCPVSGFSAFVERARRGQFEEREWTYVRKDGSHVTVTLVVTALYGPEGSLSGYLGVAKDITARKAAEERVRQSEAFLDSVIENLPNMVFVKEARDLRFVRFNKAGEELVGHPREALLGKNDYDFFPTEQADSFTANDRAVIAGRQMLDIPDEPIQTVGKGLRYLHAKKIPLYDASGAPQYLVGISEDITERKIADAALQERHQLAVLSAELHAAMLAELTLDEMLQHCSEILMHRLDAAFARIWLIGPGDLCQTCHKAAHCADRTQCLHLTASSGLSRNLDGEYRRVPLGALKIGRIAQGLGAMYTNDVLNDDRLPNKDWMRANGLVAFAGHPMRIGERVSGVVMMFARRALTDVELMAFELAAKTISLGVERKQTEEALHRRQISLDAANKELEAFAYSVSHDLRAPLRSIDGFSQALLEDCAEKLDAEGQDYLHRVRSASQRMGLLIDDLLDLSRVTRREFRRETVDLSALAQTVMAGLRQSDPDRQVACVVAPGLTASGDAGLLRIVLENLVGNAWKFTGKQAQARIEFGATVESGVTTYFVRDNGAGFDMAYADKLFAPFQRLHGMTEFPGTGIGLATVLRVVQRHGGRVWAEGAVDRGATVSFTLDEYRSGGRSR